MEKILPIKEPPVRCYLYHAYRLSVASLIDTFPNYLHNNYIQLTCTKIFPQRRDLLDFYHYNFDGNNLDSSVYYSQKVSRKNIANLFGSIVDFIIANIDDGWYVETFINEFFLPGTAPYQTFDFDHRVFIYGYNLKEKTFNIATFDNIFIYKYFNVHFEELNQAYQHVSEKNYHLVTFLYKPLPNLILRFDFKTVFGYLHDFIHGENRFFTTVHDFGNVWGSSVYQYLLLYLDQLVEGKVDHDIRPFHIFWEHKICMLKRMAYIMNFVPSIGPLYEKYTRIEQKSLVIRNIYLKYLMTNETKLLLKMKNLFLNIIAEEKPILEAFLRIIDKKIVNF